MTSALVRLERATRIAETRAELIRKARAEKATWEQIAAAAHMSRAGVIKLAGKAGEAK